MNDNFTTEKLLLYLFNETNLPDTVLVQKAIDHDPEVECEFENMKATLAFLDQCLVAPSEKTIRKILEFSAGHPKS